MENNIKIDYLIALCHTINSYNALIQDIAKECGPDGDLKTFSIEKYTYNTFDYESMTKTLDNLSELFKNIDKCYQSEFKHPNCNLSKHSKKIQEFYLKYIDVFDIIENFTHGELNKFMSPILISFEYSKFLNLMGNNALSFERNKIDTFIYFYKYIFSHQNNLDKILAVLNRIQQLGFDKLEFKDIDFTKERTYVNSNFRALSSIVYLNNIVVLPTNNSECIISTTDSNYKIEMPVLIDKKEYNDAIVKKACKITVNSLVFDVNSLPQKITKEDTLDKIINAYNQYNEKKDIIDHIKKLTGLYTCICEYTDSSIKNLEPLDKKVNQLDDIEMKDKLLELLSRVKIDLNELKKAYVNFETDVAENNSISSKIVPLLNEMAIEETSHSYQKSKSRYRAPQSSIPR